MRHLVLLMLLRNGWIAVAPFDAVLLWKPAMIASQHRSPFIASWRSAVAVVWVLAATSMLVWPFSLSIFSSQPVGVAMLAPCLALLFDRHRHVQKNIPWQAWIPLALLVAIVGSHLLLSTAESELYIFLVYLLKIPLLFALSLGALALLKRVGLSPTCSQVVLWLAVLPPLVVIAAQLASPNFQAWSIAALGGFRANEVIDNEAHGHAFRFLGVNGFLFASHGVAFALTALGLLVFSTRFTIWPSFFFRCVETGCILASLASGRSALPLVLAYILLRISFARGWGHRLVTCCGYVLFGFMLVQLLQTTTEGRQFVYWLAEPVITSIDRGMVASASMDETLLTFRDIAGPSPIAPKEEVQTQASMDEPLLTLRDIAVPSPIAPKEEEQTQFASQRGLLIGDGLFFRDNNSYSAFEVSGSDSGVVRIVYASGYVGLALFLLFWIMMFIKAFISTISNYRIAVYSLIFCGYSVIFFIKSEWMYQNFFIFYFFSLLVSLGNQEGAGRDEKCT